MRSKPRVAVFGDAILDVSVYADAYKTTQEDHSVRVYPAYPSARSNENLSAGGAANLAVNLAAMGCSVHLYAPQAKDDRARQLAGVLKDNGIPWETCGLPDRTTTKIRYYESGRLVARVDEDGQCRPMPSDIDNGQYDAILVSDYGKGAIGHDNVAKLKGGKALIMVDPYLGRTWMWRRSGVDTLVMNWVEASEFVEAQGDQGSVEEGGIWARSAYARAGANYVVVKRGQYGSVLAAHAASFGAGGPFQIPPYQTHAGAVADVQGAGDTYLAGYAAGRLRGLPAIDACHLGSVAAGIAVKTRGTAVARQTQTAKAVLGVLMPKPILAPSVPDAVAVANRARGLGLEVGYTNGCFDGRLHAGHRHVLREAEAQCGFLMVGIDSDQRVRALKGSGRPIVPAEERAASVAAVMGKGCVFVFDDDPAVPLGWVEPDFLFKGGDYAPETMPEIAVSGFTGTFVNVGTSGSESTTDYIRRIGGAGCGS